MPELPEVETIVRDLRPKLVGLRLRDAWVDKEKVLRQVIDPDGTVGTGGLKWFNKEIKNKKILSVRRRAKYIVMDIEGPRTIFIHQKISGHLLYGKWIPLEVRRPKGTSAGHAKRQTGPLTGWMSAIPGPLRDDPKNRFIRFVLNLSNGHQLALSDLRRFGKVILVNDRELEYLREIKKLGPEPLEMGYGEFKKRFGSASRRKRGRIKQVLMDPTFVAGIGNIYSDEILWHAGIHPLERVEKLTDPEIKRIFAYTKKVLTEAIRRKGSSMDDYRRPTGQKGSFQDVQKAYHRTKEKCSKRDGGIIHRLKIGGRSAHYCPVHQILK
ncbi:MAG: hypothetical protein A2941_01060 [Candidatus Yanofskybacteria bacterium RIFCSPLOWO2_01_FULL_49_17]|uniref:Formamidopyrimidine-DNA glycosylase catalytic domain-containing protein n=1 Tax=Candidatus Yanofskybacteria bacterium RIFCSPLOWO2_01_FULL_49_17 TaxID=1802700 RepID=A0A1F8GPR6_9BACT|nr:MAG: hypothetical protein A2941_01060 [Candidatus Yanofskybacteria bacterium RIFCSPLOWO2_01_FULL_49_17]